MAMGMAMDGSLVGGQSGGVNPYGAAQSYGQYQAINKEEKGEKAGETKKEREEEEEAEDIKDEFMKLLMELQL